MAKLERKRPNIYIRECKILLLFVLGCVPTRFDSPLNSSDSTNEFKTELTIANYTSQCLKKLGIAAEDTPQFNCSKAIYYKRYSRDERGGWKSRLDGFGGDCINPDGANNRTCTGLARVGAATYLTVNASNNLIAFVTMCSGTLLQVIAHRFDSGDTCFFEGRSESKLSALDSFRKPIEYYSPFSKRTCVTCHSPYPFTNTPLIRTSQLLHKLGISDLDDDVKFWSQMPDIPAGVKRLPESGLLNGKSPVQLRALYDEHKSRILEVEGTPSNVFLDKNKEWQTLKYTVVAKGELEAISAPGAWDIDHYVSPAMEPCQACHKLSARHHNARTAALVMGHCDVPEKAEAICRGLDRTTLDIHLNGIPHNTLYGTALRKNPGIVQGINEWVSRCVGRKSEGCVSKDDN
jgi:hypothetical protein